ncbi:MAG: phosphatase PAP2 family protein [Vicinamibacterales bacterium]
MSTLTAVTFLAACLHPQAGVVRPYATAAAAVSLTTAPPSTSLPEPTASAQPAESASDSRGIFDGLFRPDTPIQNPDRAAATFDERVRNFGRVKPSRLTEQQQPTPHPPPEHTGFKALVYETGSDFKWFPRRPSTWVILGIGGGAAALALPVEDELNSHLAGSTAAGRFFAPGKYIGAFPTQAAVATTLYIVGRYVMPHAQGEPKTNKVSHLGFDLMRAVIVSQALTQGLKNAVRRDRPNGECCSFPSGHASATFATAAVLERHFGYRASWPTLAIAAYVASSRLHDNVHFLSDVLFGSALGMASGWTVVGRHGRSSYAMLPIPVKGGMTLTLVRVVPRN